MTNGRGRAVIVSGASRGLGLETALGLAAGGFEVWAGYRDEAQAARISEAAASRGVSLRPVRLDVTTPESAGAAVAQVVAQSGGLYGVVNNAAITLRGYFEDLSDAEIRRTFDVNLFGAMNLTRAALPHLRAAGRGRIVMMSSVGGRIGSMTLTAYVASKFAIEGFSESLSLELEPLGIQVVIIEPGIVRQRHLARRAARRAERARDPVGPVLRVVHSRRATGRRARPDLSAPSRGCGGGCSCGADGSQRPRLRYTVGRRASFVMSLRRHLARRAVRAVLLRRGHAARHRPPAAPPVQPT